MTHIDACLQAPLASFPQRMGFLSEFLGRLVGVLVALVLPLGVSGTEPASAPKETSVVLYCSQDQFLAEPLLAEFTRQTGIKVRAVFDSEAVKTVGLANRLLAERKHPGADVFWGNEEFRTRWLASQDVFVSSNGWSAFGQRTRRIVINTNRVALAEAPASVVELTNVHWRGRVSIAFPLFGTTATHLLALRSVWGEPRWAEWCRALVANRPLLEEGNSQVVARVGRGEAWIGLTDSDDIAAGQQEHLPVVGLALDRWCLRLPNTVGIVRGSRHPVAAGRLRGFLESKWVTERLVAAGGLEPVDPVPITFEPDWDRIVREFATATRQLEDIFRR